MKLHRFVNDWFWQGRVKYHAGQAYEPNEETTVAVAAGHAEVTDGKAGAPHFTPPPEIAKAAAQAQADSEAADAAAAKDKKK